jgi:hypothetical protein
MPANIINSIQASSEKWWHKFKLIFHGSPVEIAQFIINNPNAAPTILNKEKWRKYILNSPAAIKILLATQPPLQLPEDFPDEAIRTINGDFADDIEVIDELITENIIPQLGVVGESERDKEIIPYAFKENIEDAYTKPIGETFKFHNANTNKEVELVRLENKYVYFVQTGLPLGLTQHQQLDWLYLSVSPELIEDNIRGKTGQDYIHETEAAIKAKHPDSKQIVFVLGEREIDGNFKAYANYAADAEPTYDRITHKQIIKGQQGADFDADIYYIQSSGPDQLNLDNKAFESLYDVINQCMRGEATLRVHCRQGVDRTGVLVFATQLLANFNNIFNGSEAEIAKKVKQQYQILRQSRGPNILKTPDLIQFSIKFAFVLKAIEIQRVCENELRKFDADGAEKELAGLHTCKTLAEQKTYLQQMKQAESNANKMPYWNYLLGAIENRITAEKMFQAQNKFVEAFVEKISRDFGNFVSNGGEVTLEHISGKEVTKEKVLTPEEVKQYWTKKAGKAGFANDNWFLQVMDFLAQKSSEYAKVKQTLVNLYQQVNSENISYEKLKQIENELVTIKLPELATLNIGSADNSNDIAAGLKGFYSDFERSVKGLAKDKEKIQQAIMGKYKYPKLQELLAMLRPMRTDTIQNWSQDNEKSYTVEQAFYNDLTAVIVFLEHYQIGDELSLDVKNAIIQVFSNDELPEQGKEIFFGELLKLKPELFAAIKHAFADKLLAPDVVEDNRINEARETITVNLIDLDGTLIIKGLNDSKKINMEVVEKVTEQPNAQNIAFSQRNVALSLNRVLMSSELPISTAVEQAQRVGCNIEKVCLTNDRFYTTGEVGDYYKAIISPLEQVMLIERQSVEKREKDVADITSEMRQLNDADIKIYMENGVKEQHGKIRQFLHVAEKLAEQNPNKQFNFIFMDDSLDNLKEIQAYFDRMDELQAMGLVTMPVARPKLIWVQDKDESEQLHHYEKPDTKALATVREAIATSNKATAKRILAENKNEILADQAALELLVEHTTNDENTQGAKTHVIAAIKLFLAENYAEIAVRYISNKNIITTLKFETILKKISKDINLTVQHNQADAEALIRFFGEANGKATYQDIAGEITDHALRQQEIEKFLSEQAAIEYTKLKQELTDGKGSTDLLQPFADFNELDRAAQVLMQTLDALNNCANLQEKLNIVQTYEKIYKNATALANQLKVLCRVAPHITEEQLKAIVKIEDNLTSALFVDKLKDYYAVKIDRLMQSLADYSARAQLPRGHYIDFLTDKLIKQDTDRFVPMSLERFATSVTSVNRIFDSFKAFAEHAQVQTDIKKLERYYYDGVAAQNKQLWPAANIIGHIFATFDELKTGFNASKDNWDLFWKQQRELLQQEATAAGRPELSGEQLDAKERELKAKLTDAYFFAVIRSVPQDSKAYQAITAIMHDIRSHYVNQNRDQEDCLQALQKKYKGVIDEVVANATKTAASKETIAEDVAQLCKGNRKIDAAILLLGENVRHEALQTIIKYWAQQDDGQKLAAALKAMPPEYRNEVEEFFIPLNNKVLASTLHKNLSAPLTNIQVQAINQLPICQMKQGELALSLSKIIGKPCAIKVVDFAQIKSEQVYLDFKQQGIKVNPTQIVSKLMQKVQALKTMAEGFDNANKTFKKSILDFLPWRKNKTSGKSQTLQNMLESNIAHFADMREFEQQLQKFKLLQQAAAYLNDGEYQELVEHDQVIGRQVLIANAFKGAEIVNQIELSVKKFKTHFENYQAIVSQQLSKLSAHAESLRSKLNTEMHIIFRADDDELLYEYHKAIKDLQSYLAKLPDIQYLQTINNALGLDNQSMERIIILSKTANEIVEEANSNLANRTPQKPSLLKGLFSKNSSANAQKPLEKAREEIERRALDPKRKSYKPGGDI